VVDEGKRHGQRHTSIVEGDLRGTFAHCECVSCPVWGVCQVGVGALCP
jgi:hypothetical protein